MTMNYEDLIQEALDIVSAWEIPPEKIAEAVNDQARLMAGMDFYYSGEDHPEYRLAACR
jgi:hypothetical protein